MSDDLHRALEDLVAGTAADHDARGGLPVAGMTARAHRRRRARAAAAGTGALAVVAVLAVGGSALLGRPAPLPAGPGPAPSPTSPAPTPSPSSPGPTPVTALPTGDATLPFGVCGSLRGAASEAPVDDRWQVDLALGADRIATGEPLPVTASVQARLAADWSPNGATVGLLADSGPDLLVLRGDVVVAVGDLYGDVPATVREYAAATGVDPQPYLGTLPLTSCADGGDLPTGAYEVVATALALPLGDDDAVLASAAPEALAAQHAGDWRRAVGTPVPFSIVDSGASTAPAPAVQDVALAPEPACGATLADVDTGRGLVLDAPAPTGIRAGETFAGRATLTYAGPGRLRATIGTEVRYWVTDRAGTVIGVSRTPEAHGAAVDLGTGSVLDLTATTGLLRCDGSDPGVVGLSSGAFTVHPVLPVFSATVRLPGGDVLDLTASDDALVVRGEPFALDLG